MAMYELDGNHLLPVRLGRSTDAETRARSLAAIQRQVVDVLRRPLFPLGWDEVDHGQSLTALDATGHVVLVEVLGSLDSAGLMAAMSRLTAAAAAGRRELASRYTGGLPAFREDWNEFREAMPAQAESGPRLTLLTMSLAPDVRSSMSVLDGSGVELYEVDSRVVDESRVVVVVDRVQLGDIGPDGPLLVARSPRPGLPGSRAAEQARSNQPVTGSIEVVMPEGQPQGGGASRAQRGSAARAAAGAAAGAPPPPPSSGPAVSAGSAAAAGAEPTDPGRTRHASGAGGSGGAGTLGQPPVATGTTASTPVAGTAGVRQTDRAAAPARPRGRRLRGTAAGSHVAAPSGQGPAGQGAAQSAPSSASTPPQGDSEAAHLAEAWPVNTSPGRPQEEEIDAVTRPTPEVSAQEAADLAAIARRLEGPARIIWQGLRRGIYHEAVLSPGGVITLVDGRTFSDPTSAANAAQGSEDADGWRVWRLGLRGRPLADLREELHRSRA